MKKEKDFIDGLPSKYLRVFIRKLEHHLFDKEDSVLDNIDYRKLLRETREQYIDDLNKKIKKREKNNLSDGY